MVHSRRNMNVAGDEMGMRYRNGKCRWGRWGSGGIGMNRNMYGSRGCGN